MNTKELEVEMIRNNDTGITLAGALNISVVSFSKKKNAKETEFTQGEILIIKNRYNLSPERLDEIFFTEDLS